MTDATLLALLCGSIFLAVATTYSVVRERFEPLAPVRAPVRRPEAPRAGDPAMTRRSFGRAAAGVALAGLGLGLGAAPVSAQDATLVTDIPDNAVTVKAVGYVNEGVKPSQSCKSCMLYQPGPDGRGKCSLFAKGVVKETGWCASWVARPS